MRKEMRKLCYRGNCLIRSFRFCNEDVKCTLFKSFCHSLYCSSLWSTYRDHTFQRLKVNYNNIMRRLMNVPPFSSASFLFGSLGVKTLMELLRNTQYSLMKRIEFSSNSLIAVLKTSDAYTNSIIRQHWHTMLFPVLGPPSSGAYAPSPIRLFEKRPGALAFWHLFQKKSLIAPIIA